jgi:oligopeptide/dipeptide ABC transporter ATP-binding protein
MSRVGTEGETPTVVVDEVTVTYPRGRGQAPFRAVDNVSLSIPARQTLGLVGESGSGKSTLGSAIVGLVPVSSGRIEFDGRDITHAAGAERRELTRHIQIVFQDPFNSLNPSRNIGQIIGEPLRFNLGLDQAAVKDRVRELLTEVGLPPEAAARYPAHFSGGQRQRIAIARALAMSPSLIVCDEPVSSLDLSVQAQILNLLRGLQARLGVTYLFISHDLAVIRHVSQRIAVMYSGEIVELGSAERVSQHPAHPYTRALIAAAPVPDPALQMRRRESAGAADRPSMTGVPATGCRFAPRCPFAVDVCRAESPALLKRADGSAVGCHRYDEISTGSIGVEATEQPASALFVARVPSQDEPRHSRGEA